MDFFFLCVYNKYILKYIYIYMSIRMQNCVSAPQTTVAEFFLLVVSCLACKYFHLNTIPFAQLSGDLFCLVVLVFYFCCLFFVFCALVYCFFVQNRK